jgi:hypothetical protein
VIDQEPLPTGTQHDKRLQFRTQSVGHGDSRARIDTVADRLERLGLLLQDQPPDWERLREWRVSQMMALGFFPEDE